MKELFDIAKWYASGEEAVMAIFIHGDGKMAPDSSQGHHPMPLAKVLRW
jgi:hypothetical protein